MIKKFLEWIRLKERLHINNYEPPLFKEGEVWWCYIGENIGNEINGKSRKFTRPIFIFKKYDRYTFCLLKIGPRHFVAGVVGTSQICNHTNKPK